MPLRRAARIAALVLWCATTTAAGDGSTAARAGSQTAGATARADIARAIDASAYVIVDLRTGRTVRAQRGEWLDTPVWPGSIAKLATLAAAIDAGTLTDTTRIVCSRRVTLAGGRRADCSHPPVGRGLSAVEAIAHSCNAFTASIARTLTRAQLAQGFVTMGLTPPPPGADPIASAIGLDGAKVAPRRLIEPLLRVSRRARGSRDAHSARSGASEPPSVREGILFDGLRESARRGTASAFGDAGIDALAKTGTAPMRGGQPLGLVAALVPSTTPRYAIVVALPGGSGAQAAETAAAILAPLLTAEEAPTVEPASRAPRPAPPAPPSPPQSPPPLEQQPSTSGAPSSGLPLRVGRPTANGYAIDRLTVEEYVAQVVAGETSSATPRAARDALAVTARTYAMVNRGRHQADGFDLCTLTHCQVVRPASTASRAAAERTRGRLLTREGRAVPVFYSASCGGTLADPRLLLPDAAPQTMSWLAARPDPAGIEEKRWQTEIRARDLLASLQKSGARGDALRHLSVQAAADGIVMQVTIEGMTPPTLTGDAFRRAIGQHLGWHLLKSLRFTVDRTAAGYRFTGRGHGHGVGLCVLGASALATRGWDATRILQSYFPGLQITLPTRIERAQTEMPQTAMPQMPEPERDASRRDARRGDLAPNAIARLAARPPATKPRAEAQNAREPEPAIALRLPEADERHRARVTRLLDTGLRDLAARLDVVLPDRLSVVVHPTGDSYRRATSRPWWTSAATLVGAKGRIELHLAPLDALDRAGRLERTLRHELVHVLTVRALADRPRWVHEGLARHYAGERVTVDPADAPRATDPCPSDRELLRAPDRAAFERAYDRAAACVARDLAAGRHWRDLGVP